MILSEAAPRVRSRAIARARQLPSDQAHYHRLLFALRAARMYVWECDMVSGQVLRFGNPEDVLGADIGTREDFLAHVHADDRDRVRDVIDSATAQRLPYELEFRFLGTDGVTRWMRNVGQRQTTEAGDSFVGVCFDVTAEVEARGAVERLAVHDALTGLVNRAHLGDRASAALNAMRDEGAPVAILGVDLDRFKSVNDVYGHKAADELLVEVASFLQSVCRPTDVAGRVGGDQFVLVLAPGDVESVEQVARTLFARAQSPFIIGGTEVFVGFSLGVGIGPHDGRDAETLLRASDVALSRAKADARGTLCFFEPGMHTGALRRQRLEQDLRMALARDQVFLAYQPLVGLDRWRIDGVEALMRWLHPEHGLISPAEFIPLAEASGLIVQLGEWALREACRAALDWPGVRVSVNVSAVQLRQSGFLPMLVDILADTGLEPRRLEIEVTESVLLDDTMQAVAVLGRVKSLGVTIAMDDFGTGFSSLSYLSRFTFDKIKIDGSFTRSLGCAREPEAVVRAVVNIGRSLGITINAEGVETIDQLRFLQAEGCDQVQGYLLSRPVSACEFAERLRREALGEVLSFPAN